MLIIGSQRASEIEKLQLPPALKSLTRGEFVHPDLEFRCGRLRYTLEPEDFSTIGLDVIPLWEGESSITGFYYNDALPVFIIYNTDDIDSPVEIGRSIRELVEFLANSYSENESELKNILLDTTEHT